MGKKMQCHVGVQAALREAGRIDVPPRVDVYGRSCLSCPAGLSRPVSVGV